MTKESDPSDDPSSFEEALKSFFQGEKHNPENMQKAFQTAVEYFEKLNKILATGSEEEKKKAMDEFMQMKKAMDKAVNNIRKETGLSEEQVRAIMHNPDNYSPEDWEVIQESVDELKSIEGLSDQLGSNMPEEKPKKPKKKKTKRDKWMKS